MNGPIRIAIIGYGKIAQDQHAPSIAANDRFELVATVSRSGGGPPGLRCFTSHDEMIAAMKGGLDPSIPADMAAGRRPAKMKDDERVIYDLLTQIYRDKKVTDAAFNAAVAKFGDKGVADIVAIASYYGVTSMSLIATNTSAEPTEEPRLQELAQVFPR